MKKTAKAPIYLRYEFSDESGIPEGGDVIPFETLSEVQNMTKRIIDVAQGDGVAVHITLGHEEQFFGVLAEMGLRREDVESEMVDPEQTKTPAKSAKKAGKKPGQKTTQKTPKNAAEKAAKKKAR